ncbi:aspartate/glutamate racemase family protein [candidate division KSB1 bacterium]|nr:aspartate/glutamate racemase family protein [candidate division KSB1 bacterium]
MKGRIEGKTVPVVGILGWDKKSNDTLAQLESIPGNISHPDTFSFPVMYKEVPGACYQTVVVNPDKGVQDAMIKSARMLEEAGVHAIMGNCGFDALFQKDLAEAVRVPVFTSSLLLVPLVYRMFAKARNIGIITADKPFLTKEHLQAVGITDEIPIRISGLDKTEEFQKIRSDINATLDVEKLEKEVLHLAEELVREPTQIVAIVLECTDLPPFAAAIRKSTGVPVFDIVTLAYMVYEAISGNRWSYSPIE